MLELLLISFFAWSYKWEIQTIWLQIIMCMFEGISISIEVSVPFIVSTMRIDLMISRLSDEMDEKVLPLRCSRRVAANIGPVTKKSTRSLHKQSYMIHSDGITNYEHINHSTTYNLCYVIIQPDKYATRNT